MSLPVPHTNVLPLPKPGAVEPLFPSEEPTYLCAGPRRPDEQWSDGKGHHLQVWFVGLGRRQGVRVDWQRDGVPKRSFTFQGPGQAKEYVERWQASDTSTLPPAA